ncbi:MAG: glycosyltransferase family 2 protein [Actinomycetota bacterium]|nr:glycosyltransferase family 2 protein [Actinomycetota bacterium]
MTSDPPTTISVVIPVHNEADYLPGALAELFEEIAGIQASVTVLVAENGSTDGTAEAVRELIGRYPGLALLELPTPDYGAAMREGFLSTDGEWAVNFDIDYFSGEFLRSVLAVGDDADLVLASKRAEGADDRRGHVRRFATWTFNQVLRFVLSSGVSDTHGMKAIRRDVIDRIAPEVISTQDLFDTELVVRAERAGYRITEVPAVVEEKRETKSSLAKRVPRTLRGVWRIRKSLRP